MCMEVGKKNRNPKIKKQLEDRNLFEQEEYYHKLVTAGNFVSKSNSDRNKTL